MTLYRNAKPSISLCLLLTIVLPASAAQHFTDCAFGTGTSATLVLPVSADIAVDGARVQEGDEIAVYTSDGVCAGVETWTGENLAIAVWGDDIVTPDKDGLVVGEPLTFRVWDASNDAVLGEGPAPAAVVYSDELEHYTAHGRYVDNGIFVIKSMQFSRTINESDSGSTVGAEDEHPVKESVTLAPNFPNPFSARTTIKYSLNGASHVRLTVMNILGQTVRALYDDEQAPGEYEVRVDMDGLPSGVYFYQIETPSQSITRTMLLTK